MVYINWKNLVTLL